MKRLAMAVAVLIAGSAGLARIHPFDNPRTEPRKGLGTLLQHTGIPANARNVLVTKCADCHSNETRWPAYARVAPASWLIERDITEARARFNLSHWEQISPDVQDVLIAKIIQQTRSGGMPPPQYRLLHPGSRLTPADIAAIRSMGKATLKETTATSTGDTARGRLVFSKRCTGCHAMDNDREGPRLAGVFGRRAGSVPGFDYSAGLKNSGLTWNEATLDKWLTDPDLVAPDAKMDFHVPKAQERADLIAYLKQ